MNQIENINIQTVGEGHSILHVAVMLGDNYLNFIKQIVERGQTLGLNLEARNANGQRAVDSALQSGFGRIAHYLSEIMGIEYNRNLLNSASSSSASSSSENPQSTSSGRTEWASSTVSQEDATVAAPTTTFSESKTTSSNIPASIASLSTLSSSSSAALGTQQAQTVAVPQEHEGLSGLEYLWNMLAQSNVPTAIPVAVTTGSGTGSDFIPLSRPRIDPPLPNIITNSGRVIRHRNNNHSPTLLEKPWYKNTFFVGAGAILGVALIKGLHSLYHYLSDDRSDDENYSSGFSSRTNIIDGLMATSNYKNAKKADIYSLVLYPSEENYQKNYNQSKPFFILNDQDNLQTELQSIEEIVKTSQLPYGLKFSKKSPHYQQLIDLLKVDPLSQSMIKIWDQNKNEWQDFWHYPKNSPLRYIWLINYNEDRTIFLDAKENNNYNELGMIEELKRKEKLLFLKAYNELEFNDSIKQSSAADSIKQNSAAIDKEKNQNIPLNKIICIGFPKNSTFAYNIFPDLKKLDQYNQNNLKIIYDRRYVNV